MANADDSNRRQHGKMTSETRYQALFLGAGPQMQCGVGQFTRLLQEAIEKLDPGSCTALTLTRREGSVAEIWRAVGSARSVVCNFPIVAWKRVMVRPLLRSSNFRLQTGAHALQLHWSASKGKVDSVLYYNWHTNSTERIAASAVVVACGPLGSAKLLHNSTSNEFPHGLGNSAGLLGRFLHDHPREWWSFRMDKPLTLLAPAAYLTRLPYNFSPPLLATSWTLGTASVRDKVRSRFGLKGTVVGVQIIGTMIPSEMCSAKPSSAQKDEFGLPALDVCIRYSDAEVGAVIRSRQHLLNLMDEAGYGATRGETVPTLFPGTVAHYGGTARMHAKREYGVTDALNRVYDAPNVLVCDASCFTTAAEKNPTLTVMAIAARAATHLAHDLKHA